LLLRIGDRYHDNGANQGEGGRKQNPGENVSRETFSPHLRVERRETLSLIGLSSNASSPKSQVKTVGLLVAHWRHGMPNVSRKTFLARRRLWGG